MSDPSLSAVLEINFDECDVSIIEGSSTSTISITLSFRNNQNPFMIMLTPVTIERAENLSLGSFINFNSISPTFQATAGSCFQTSWFHFPLSFPSTGEDFTVEPLVITVPANQQRYAIQQFFTIKYDDIDEDEQSFAIVAEIGPDVPDGISCFQTAEWETDCFGRRGAIQIRITDNDREF